MLTSQRLHETGYVDLPVESGPKPGFCMTDCSLSDLFFLYICISSYFYVALVYIHFVFGGFLFTQVVNGRNSLVLVFFAG